MSITTLTFAGFVLLVLAVYYILPHRFQNAWLLTASYVFYLTFTWQFSAILVVMTLVNYWLARWLEQAERRKKALLWIGIGFNLAVLAFLKYAGYFVAQFTARLNSSGEPGALAILLPVGLSFTVVQAISYLVDVSRKQTQASTRPVDFALYFAYFPKLTSGPIERARTFLPLLAQPRRVDNRAIAENFTRIVVGLVRKMILANAFTALAPTSVLQDPSSSSPLALMAWLVAYAFAIYNDFAGYTSIARGVSGLIGIELSPNFEAPYFSRNFTEFWNRWHISLSNWLRDYIYLPISRALLRRNPSRGNIANLIVPPIVTMLVSALWHEAALHMLIWGLLHGIYQVVERIPSLRGPLIPVQKLPRWRQVAGALVVFVLAALAWLPFRASLPEAGRFLAALATNWPLLPSTSWMGLAGVTAMLVPALALDALQAHSGELVFLRWPRLVQAGLLAGVILAVFLVSQTYLNVPTFVYQGF
ncbi:MAG: MBOAT family protein [Anaerolineae bacterium]|nr:MBOAT family protein [Anaerolineae bacterium]